MIPIIDLFAGPGGLGEGFSSFRTSRGEQPFRIALSIEKDPVAHQTLKLRSFFREFSRREVPSEYHDHLRGQKTAEELYACYPEQGEQADSEAWNAELGNNDVPNVADRSSNFAQPQWRQELAADWRTALSGLLDWRPLAGDSC